MSRVIQTNKIGTERNRLTKSIVIAIRELMKQSSPDGLTRDLAAYIALALIAVSDTIDTTVSAWEKRDYWVKADRFRLEWEWSARLGEEMQAAVLGENWPKVASLSVAVAEKLKSVKVSPRHRLGEPWVGAWEELSRQKNN